MAAHHRPAGLGDGLPELRPGCGSKTLEPGIAEDLTLRFGDTGLQSREIELGDAEDPIEACYERGWSDGLPVVPPTGARVLRMLQGTTRKPDEVIGLVPPDLVPCTVEKVAINAVMAGCKPEYMPVVLAAVEAALIDEFGMHGLLCTTMFAGPLVIVNGPVAQPHRHQLRRQCARPGHSRQRHASAARCSWSIRNVGGGRPGEIDRATLGTPGKYSFCFAEAEDSAWEPLSVAARLRARGVDRHLVRRRRRARHRRPEVAHARVAGAQLALSLRAVDHPKLAMAGDALLVVSPDHCRVFHEAGWSKARLHDELTALLQLPGDEIVVGAQGIAEGVPAALAGKTSRSSGPAAC